MDNWIIEIALEIEIGLNCHCTSEASAFSIMSDLNMRGPAGRPATCGTASGLSILPHFFGHFFELRESTFSGWCFALSTLCTAPNGYLFIGLNCHFPNQRLILSKMQQQQATDSVSFQVSFQNSTV